MKTNGLNMIMCVFSLVCTRRDVYAIGGLGRGKAWKGGRGEGRAGDGGASCTPSGNITSSWLFLLIPCQSLQLFHQQGPFLIILGREEVTDGNMN